jgi:uracil-DNA glycosylase
MDMHESWKEFLDAEFNKPYFKELSEFLTQEYQNKIIFPKKTDVFRAFTTDLRNVKVVILGQDPYHTPRTAEGLAFSVPFTEPVPPSLRNIYKEIENDLGRESVCKFARLENGEKRPSGNLRKWQTQGVLLLNAVLTVEAHKAGSHRGRGWETFTTATIEYLNQTRPHLVFILWGRDARNKKSLIDNKKHLILESAHPSPLSAHNGFFNQHHFSKANEFLKKNNLKEIIW